MLWLLYVLLTAVVLVAMNRWMRNEQFDKIPGPKGFFLFGNSLDFLMDAVKTFYYFQLLTSTYKNLFKLQLGPKRFLILYSPEDVEAIISGTKYNTKGFIYTFIKPWLKSGLLLSDGLKWQQRRKILTHAFHFKILNHFNSILVDNTKTLVEKLHDEVHKPKTDVLSYINDFALNSISETAMGTKLDPDSSNFGRRYKDGIHNLGQLLVYRVQRVWMYPNFIFAFTDTGRIQKQTLELLTSFRDSVVNKRRESGNAFNIILNDDDVDNDYAPGKKKLAMLDLLLQAEKEGAIDAEGIGEEVDTFMFEGHDTTARALQFAFMVLANNPDAQNKIVAECDQIFGESTRTATMTDLGQMKYLECCIKESLRLYPPVLFMSRNIKEDTPLQNSKYTVPTGTDCIILIAEMHRRKDQFVEPLEFRPERFLVEPTWHPYCYIPFSAGPRNCIGQKFAMMEMKLVLSAVLRRYRLLPITKPLDIVFIIDFLLRSRDPIYVKFEKRD